MPASRPIPRSGSVLGVDVGFSPTRRSSAVCRLDWDDRRITWHIDRFRALPAEMTATIAAVAGNRRLQAAAFDGPLRTGFDVIGRYRAAEKMLTARLGRKIGKPGQTNAPVGKLLNAAANACVRVVLETADVAPAANRVAIDTKAVVEAFPTGFMGMMLPATEGIIASRNDRSDVFFQMLVETGALRDLAAYLLPGRTPEISFVTVRNHDDRAALICALTALCVAATDFTAVGDADGWIILPPRPFIQPWAWNDLRDNAHHTAMSDCHLQLVKSGCGPECVANPYQPE